MSSASAAAILRCVRSREASSAPSSTPISTSICSFSSKEIYLHDWWLIKADIEFYGKRLGVGGFTTQKSQGLRGFFSAPIIKRHDAVTLQTADGITITVSGHLNRPRTLENGFPMKICNDFVFGFPYYWEEFAALSSDIHKMTSENSKHVPLDDFPVSMLHDHCMSTLEHHETSSASKNYFDDILQSIVADASCDEVSSPEKESSLHLKKTFSSPGEALFNHKVFNAERRRKDNKVMLVSEPLANEEQRITEEKSEFVDKEILGSGPLTRSRSRLLKQNQISTIGSEQSGGHPQLLPK